MATKFRFERSAPVFVVVDDDGDVVVVGVVVVVVAAAAVVSDCEVGLPHIKQI